MRYSFDDMDIRQVKESGSSLKSKEISHPNGLNNHTWYFLSAEVYKLLNKWKSAK